MIKSKSYTKQITIKQPQRVEVTQGKERVRLGRVLQFGLFFLLVLICIVYLQFSFADSGNDQKYPRIQTSKAVENESKSGVENESKSGVENESKSKEEKVQVNQNSSEEKDHKIQCSEIFIQKREIDIKQLIQDVEKDYNSLQHISQERKTNLMKQILDKSQKLYSTKETKINFQKKEIQQMQQELSNTNDNEDQEKAQDSESYIDKSNKHNPQTNKANQKEVTQKKSKRNTSDSLKGMEKTIIDRISLRDLSQLECFLQFYDENQLLLTFELIKHCEFIEHEYILLKFEGKTSLYDLMIQFYKLITIIEKQKIALTQSITHSQYDVFSNLLYLSKVILNDLFQTKQKIPEIFQYVDPEIEEILQINSALPMKQTVKNLVEVWENNWVELGLHNSSHLSIKKKKSRKSKFNKIMEKVNTTSSSRIKQQATFNNQKQQQQQQQELFDINLSSSQENELLNKEKDQNYNIQQNGFNLNISSENSQAQINREDGLDQVNLQTIFVEDQQEELVQNENTNQTHKNQNEKAQNTQDQLNLSFSELDSQDLDEVITLKEQVRLLWKSKEWKQNYKGLQLKNFFLATRIKKKK